MNCSKIASEILFKRLSISQIAKKYNISKAEVVQSIFDFFTTFPNSSHIPSIKHRFKVELTKEFLAYTSPTFYFAEEYGIDIRIFRKLMKEVIDDQHIIKSDAVAINLFRKTMDGVAIIAKYVPKRIVKQIAISYVNDSHLSQYNLANIYGTRRDTISLLLKRAISENIVDDVTAEKIFVLVRSYSTAVDGYIAAFDKRAKVKAEQQT